MDPSTGIGPHPDGRRRRIPRKHYLRVEHPLWRVFTAVGAAHDEMRGAPYTPAFYRKNSRLRVRPSWLASRSLDRGRTRTGRRRRLAHTRHRSGWHRGPATFDSGRRPGGSRRRRPRTTILVAAPSRSTVRRRGSTPGRSGAAVTTPTGSDRGAKACWAIRSLARTTTAPRTPTATSTPPVNGPSSMRAMWGIISATNPTGPATATATAPTPSRRRADRPVSAPRGRPVRWPCRRRADAAHNNVRIAVVLRAVLAHALDCDRPSRPTARFEPTTLPSGAATSGYAS